MDYKTLFFVLVSVFVIQAVAIIQSWYQNRSEIGLRDWSIAASLLAGGCLMIVVGIMGGDNRPVLIPGSFSRLSIAFGDGLGVAGWCMTWVGARHFFYKQTISYRSVVLMMVALTAIMVLENYTVLPSWWRIFWASSAIALFAAMTMFEFLQYQLLSKPAIVLVIVVLFLTTVIWFWRVLSIFITEYDVGIVRPVDVAAIYDGIVASVSLTVSMILLTNARINQRLQEQAIRDPLTGALNRRAFYEYANSQLADTRRTGRDVCISLIDLDHFKKINDRHGHTVGDRVLKQFTELAQAVIREGDLFARYGGEEFVIMFRDSDLVKAGQILTRLQDACAAHKWRLDEDGFCATFSAGLYHLNGAESITLDALLEKVDSALYRAKDGGRDRVEIATTPYLI